MAFMLEFPWQNWANWPQKVCGSDAHNVGLFGGVCPFCDWNTDRARNSPPLNVTLSSRA